MNIFTFIIVLEELLGYDNNCIANILHKIYYISFEMAYFAHFNIFFKLLALERVFI